MMSKTWSWLDHLEYTLPPVLTTMDLVKFGIFTSRQTACIARRTGNCPPYLKINPHRILYQKTYVLQWLKEKETNLCKGPKDGNVNS